VPEGAGSQLLRESSHPQAQFLWAIFRDVFHYAAVHTASIAEILNSNASGPRRLGYGTIREHLLGITVAMADGRLIHSGGKVVKNVAGYDLCKLFVGSRGSLGVLVEATFKVGPLPEVERFVAARCDSPVDTVRWLGAVPHDDVPALLRHAGYGG
jgi:glycolate oxidase FAD binding subunit